MNNSFSSISEFISVLTSAENVSGRNEKIRLLKSISSNQFLIQISHFVFNNLITLGVTTSSFREEDLDIKSENVFKNDSEIFTSFSTFVETLSTRKITGFEARDVLLKFLKSLPDESYRFWYKRFFDKKFVTGVSVGTISKVYPELKPKYDVQTCETWNPEMNIDFENENWIAEYKIDGMRSCCIKHNNAITFLSRDFRNLPEENLNQFLPLVEPILNRDYILDGELFAGDWNSTVSIVKSLQVHSDVSKLKFYIFDSVLHYDFLNGKSNIPLEDRKRVLEDIEKDNRIVIVTGTKIQSNQHLLELLDKSIEDGFEGLVIKNLDSPYEGKRSSNWLKVKKFYTEDFTIVDVVAGSGKYSSQPTLAQCRKAVLELNLQESAEELFSHVPSFLGAVTIESSDGTNCNVGSGFSDSQRIYFSYIHTCKESIIGKLCEVEFQEKTKDGSLRFPTFKRLRLDR